MESFIKQLNKGCLLTLAQENVLLDAICHRTEMIFQIFMAKQLKACSSKRQTKESLKEKKLNRSQHMVAIKEMFEEFRSTAEKEGWVVH